MGKKLSKEQGKQIGILIEAYAKYFVMQEVAKVFVKDKSFRKITRKYLGWRWKNGRKKTKL